MVVDVTSGARLFTLSVTRRRCNLRRYAILVGSTALFSVFGSDAFAWCSVPPGGPRAVATNGSVCSSPASSLNHASVSPVIAGTGGQLTLTAPMVSALGSGSVSRLIRATDPNSSILFQGGLSGHLTSAGSNLIGILVDGSGAVFVVNGDASLSALSASAMGMVVRNGGSASVKGAYASVTGDDGLSAEGPNAVINLNGQSVSILTTADMARGIVAEDGGKVFVQPAAGSGAADGNALIILNNPGATVRTNGDGSNAIEAKSSSGNARVELLGGVVVTGADGSADDAEGLYALVNGGYGQASVLMSGGSVTTNGENADGIVAYTDVFFFAGDSTVTMTGGVVNANGDGSSGIVSQTGVFSGADASVFQTGGTIRTTGGTAGGLYQNSAGILALSAGSGTTRIIQSGGLVETTGDEAHGLYGVSISGDVVIQQGPGGRVMTGGADADGVHATVLGGTFDLDIGGLVQGGSGNAAGIHTIGASGTLDVSETGQVGALSGVALLDEAGDITVVSRGLIQGDILTNDGNDSVTLAPASETTGRLVLGDGSDTLRVEGTADVSGVTLFDGGDDIGPGDGYVDNLNFVGGTRTWTQAS